MGDSNQTKMSVGAIQELQSRHRDPDMLGPSGIEIDNLLDTALALWKELDECKNEYLKVVVLSEDRRSENARLAKENEKLEQRYQQKVQADLVLLGVQFNEMKKLQAEVERLKAAWHEAVSSVSDYFGGEFLMRNIGIRCGILQDEKKDSDFPVKFPESSQINAEWKPTVKDEKKEGDDEI